MPIFNYQCLYCDNRDLILASINDNMILCSQCGDLMIRLDNDFIWEFFDKNYFQYAAKENCLLVPPNGDDTLGG